MITYNALPTIRTYKEELKKFWISRILNTFTPILQRATKETKIFVFSTNDNLSMFSNTIKHSLIM